MPARRRTFLTITLALAALAALARPDAGAAQPAAPSVKLVSSGSQTIVRYGPYLTLDIGVWAAATGGDFELRVARPDYDSPLGVAQTDPATGDVLRELPADRLEGWFGLSRFVQVVVRRESGAWAAGGYFGFCPNSYERQRVDDTGPVLSRYPFSCASFSPFAKATVWGIDEGWASRVLGGESGAPWVRLRKDGTYSVTVRITNAWVEALEIPAEDATVQFDLVVKTGKRQDWKNPGFRERASARELAAAERESAAVAEITDPPDPATLPDLVALPPWAIGIERRGARDYMQFATTPWNAGPAPLVVEGFRRPGEAVMDAYQYFRDENGDVVGRAEVGEMRFHPNPMHNHWHFLQFARFTLQDASNMEVVRSRKQAFCLAPTDAIDLTVERATWSPWTTGLGTSCGSQGALWVREVLHAGWGDTYFQYVPGQSFDITALPNGWYHARVEVNPDGSLYEADTTNNVESRLVYIGGRPGKRWTVVTPWHGIED